MPRGHATLSEGESPTDWCSVARMNVRPPLVSTLVLGGLVLGGVNQVGISRAEPVAAGTPASARAPYRDPKLVVDRRVADLLARMTPAEKVAQLGAVNWDHTRVYDARTRQFSRQAARKVMPNGIGEVTRPGDKHDPREATELANAIQKFLIDETRLGIPAIVHEEALHGFVAPGATSFPQAIALAATFDPDLIEEIFTVAARQMRARGVQHALAPVVDVARDPRWGRIEETFGEDSYVASRMGVAAVNGFQGRRASADVPIDRTHVMATLKHLVGHGYPEGGRNTAPGIAPPRMLREVFLPPFEAAIHQAHVLSVMASYNELDGVPTHENRWLLRDVLRGEWGFKGLVASDYFGVAELARRHHVAPDSGKRRSGCAGGRRRPRIARARRLQGPAAGGGGRAHQADPHRRGRGAGPAREVSAGPL